MSNGYVIPIDPAEIATRFSYSDPRFDNEDDQLEADDTSNVSNEAFAEYLPDGDYESRIEPLLDRIPTREADLIYLYFIEKKRQADIATIFGVTQAAISYRLDRGIQRLKFLLNIPQVTEEELRADLPEAFPTKTSCPGCNKSARDGAKSDTPLHPKGSCLVCHGADNILIDVEILIGMWATTCQSEVASKLGLTQGRVRHRFFKAVKTLQDIAQLDSRYVPYEKIFSAVASKKFNILREVKLPQWADRGGDECV
jgi:DNA-directed RNA polymerase specialized sigma24 family protein